MLARFYRLRMLWVADQTLTFNDGAAIALRFTPWKFTAGVLVFQGVITDDMGFGAGETIVTTGEVESTVVDNSAGLYLGVKGIFKVIADLSSTDGVAYLYLEEADSDANWPSDAADFDTTKHCRLISALELSTDAVDEDASMNFEF